MSSPTVQPVGSNAAELAKLWSLGWPVVVGGVGMLAMSAVDTAMVGPLGPAALAALSAATMWIHGLGILGRGAMMGVDPIVTQAWGRGDRAEIASATRSVIVAALLLSVPMALAYQVAAPGLAVLGQPAEVLPDVAAYARAVSFGVPGWMLFWALRQVLQGMERMRPATIAVLVANGLNVVLNACLVHGWLGAPALGVQGAGFATAGSSWCMALVLAWLGRHELLALLRHPHTVGLWTGVAKLLRLGGPIALQLGVEVWGFIGAGMLVGWMGTTALAGHAVALLIASVAFMVPLGISSGATTRVGNLLGAKMRWRRSAWLAVLLGVTACALNAAILALAPGPLARLFSPDPPVIAVVMGLLPVAATFQLFDGTQVTAHGVLRGLGDVRVPMAFNVVAFWLFALPLAYVLGHTFALGPVGVWWGLVAGLGAVSVMLLLRMWQLGSRPDRVLRHD